MAKNLLSVFIIFISIAAFSQAKEEEPTLGETIEWLNEKFKTSIIPAFSHEKRCTEYFEIKINKQEIIAFKRYSCDGFNYETTYTLPLTSMDSIDVNEKVHSNVSPFTLVFKCTGGNSCITKQHKDYSAGTTKTTAISYLDLYKLNAKCANIEIKERIVKALNHAIKLVGGAKLDEKF